MITLRSSLLLSWKSMDMLQFTRRRQLRWSALLVDILMWFIPLFGTGYRCKLVSSQSPETLSLSHFTCRSCQVQGSMDKLHRVSIVGEFLICCLNVHTQVYTGTAYTTDGCATFFRRSRFTLVKKYEVGLLLLLLIRGQWSQQLLANL